jgi:hypothetical protein
LLEFEKLNTIQQNVLFASILGDGEITKIYKNSRRKNNSYREHYGKEQEEYRKWKQKFLPEWWYLTPNSNTLRSRSHPMFTELYQLFYINNKSKCIPKKLLPLCTDPHFLTILYMDDGSLSLSKRINHRKKLIYVTPHIYLYLQNYSVDQLIMLKSHIQECFDVEFNLSKRKDGHGYILKTTKIKNTFSFLKIIEPLSIDCLSMFYKTNWSYRFKREKELLKAIYPDYHILTSSAERNKAYSEDEISQLINLKQVKCSDKEIAVKLNRSYWSIVYKLKELRKDGLL